MQLLGNNKKICNKCKPTTYRSLHIAAHSRSVVVTSWTSGSSVGMTVSFCLKEQWSSAKQKQQYKWRSFPRISLVETIGCLTASTSVIPAYYRLLRTLSHSDPFMPMKNKLPASVIKTVLMKSELGFAHDSNYSHTLTPNQHSLMCITFLNHAWKSISDSKIFH